METGCPPTLFFENPTIVSPVPITFNSGDNISATFPSTNIQKSPESEPDTNPDPKLGPEPKPDMGPDPKPRPEPEPADELDHELNAFFGITDTSNSVPPVTVTKAGFTLAANNAGSFQIMEDNISPYFGQPLKEKESEPPKQEQEADWGKDVREYHEKFEEVLNKMSFNQRIWADIKTIAILAGCAAALYFGLR